MQVVLCEGENMKKKIIAITMLLTVVFVNSWTQNARSISDERAIMLINYLQYSLAQVSVNHSAIVAENEFSTLINSINPTGIKDEDIIRAYQEVQNKLTDLKILDNQKKHAQEMAEREKKNAITQIFKSPGSIFIPGSNPAIAIAYATISAGLNYAGARAQINSTKLEKEFEIKQGQIRTIDSMRSDIYNTAANVFKTRDDTNYLITDRGMKSFVEDINHDDAKTRKTRLESQKNNLKMFPPFWYALGYAQQETGNYEDALKSYEQYESMLTRESILKYDDMLCQIQFSKINIYVKQGYEYPSKAIQNCINVILQQIDKADTSDLKAQQIFALAITYRSLGDTENYAAYITKTKALNVPTWNEAVKQFQKSLSETTNPENDKLLKEHWEYTKANYKKIEKYIDEIAFSQSADGGLTVDASEIPVKLEFRVRDNKNETEKYIEPFNKNKWKVSHEELSNARAGIFKDSEYYFDILGENFGIVFNPAIGLFKKDDVGKVKVEGIGKKEKDFDIKISKNRVVMFLPTIPNQDFGTLVRKSKADIGLRKELANNKTVTCVVYFSEKYPSYNIVCDDKWYGTVVSK